MPANLDKSTQNIVLLVSSFTTIAIAVPALYARYFMMPSLRRQLAASNVSMKKSNSSLFIGCLASVALMMALTAVLTAPILLSTNDPPYDEQEALSSSINFCEQDFRNTSYIAEPANTVSSLTCYVPLALIGLIGRPSIQHCQSKRFVIIYSTLLTIGLGSMALHAFLTAETQGGDELPMLWFTAAAAFCALDIILKNKQTRLLALVVAGSAVAATATYAVGRHDFTVFYILFSLYSQTMVFSIIYITFGFDWETRDKEEGMQFKAAVLFPLAIATGWSTIVAIWTWVSEMLFCNAVMQDGAFGQVVAPFVWNRVAHPMWHFWSGLLAWLLVQVLVAAHGMQQGWGTPSIEWFGIPYVAFRDNSSKVD